MKKLIETYNVEYKEYKKGIYLKLAFLLFLFGAPLIPTIVYYDGSLFVRILFWIFASIIFTVILLLIGMFFYVSERPLYEFLYKELIDLALEDDFTHYEYDSFPYDNQFLEKGDLFFDKHSEVIRYKLQYYYLNNRIDIYSFYAYSKLHKSNKLAFNGIYFVLHNDNKLNFEMRTSGRLDKKNNELKKIILEDKTEFYTSDESKIPDNLKKLFMSLLKKYEESIYMVGVEKEIHIAIDRLYDDLAPKELDEEKLTRIKNQLGSLIQEGRDIYKKL